MNKKDYRQIVQTLTTLEKKILRTKIQEDGTAVVVVIQQELDSLDDAIVYIQAREQYN